MLSKISTALFVAVTAASLAPLAANAQGTVRGAEEGIHEGDRAAGPVGGIVGGAVGAAVGTVGGVLGVEDRPRFRSYVEEEHVRNYDYAEPVRAGVDHALRYAIVGGADRVRLGIETLLEQTQADELIVTAQIYDQGARRRSYEILANVRDAMSGDRKAA
jgi:alkanesulfonate monooxygenase SsuD/methylene tetrahydromethanopterin reductase-like flavin-dependent oxidoreductase (luciferase family)